jgi:hypothetical protein
VSLLQSEQRILVDESVIIRAQMGSTIDQKKVTASWDALYDTIPQEKPVTSTRWLEEHDEDFEGRFLH